MGWESSQCATEGHIVDCERLLLLITNLGTVAAAAATAVAAAAANATES